MNQYSVCHQTQNGFVLQKQEKIAPKGFSGITLSAPTIILPPTGKHFLIPLLSVLARSMYSIVQLVNSDVDTQSHMLNK